MYGIGEVKTSLTSADHTQMNCGMGLYDKDKVYYMPDADGKVIVDGKMCTVLSKDGYDNIAVLTLGDKKYDVVKMPDGKFWLAQNLDWLPDGVEFVTSGSETYTNTPAACYYNYTNNGLGLLYNRHAVKIIIDSLQDGWRVASENDWLTLFDSIGGNSIENIMKLKSAAISGTGSWTTPGTDIYGLDLRCTGLRGSDTSFTDSNSYYFVTSTSATGSTYRRGWVRSNSNCNFSQAQLSFYSIRLIKG